MIRSLYDYVIVGAGPAGCVLANRLSEDPANSVLLIESGPSDRHMFVRMPMGMTKLMGAGSPYIWRYQVSPGGNRAPESWMKGRTLGGSSSVNGMVYMRGVPQDYDGWAAAGCTGWGWDEMGRCFAAIERHALGAADGRGGKGALHIDVARAADPLIRDTIAAARAMGVPIVDDINGARVAQDGGFGAQTRNIRQGRRVSAATAFLDPARRRRNLTVATGAEVLSLLFEGRRAAAVCIRHDGRDSIVRAGRAILLCAGGINSPALLQRSGVGPAGLLRNLGIDVVLDAPGIGRDLLDHRTLPVRYRIKAGGSNLAFRKPRLAWSVLRYFLMRSGPLAQSTFTAGGLIKTDPTLDRPDVQIGLSPFTSGREGPHPFPGLTLYGYTLRPESRGELAIVSSDPAVPPRIDANYMAAAYDRENAVAILRWLRRLAAQPPLAGRIVEEMEPGAAIQTDEGLLESTFVHGTTGFHVAGTCRMGSDDGAVLDPQLRVRGIDGLRVVDTSMMPSLVSGNTSAPTMAIAWRAAEMILADRQ